VGFVAGVLGAGFGCFMSIDQTFATQVLPDAEHNGKDLGVMNIAMAVPQALGPLIGAWVVEYAGFSGLFAVSALFGLAGGLVVMRVRSVQ
jgi:MFS family permease